jgi:predicted nucleotidyltransferase
MSSSPSQPTGSVLDLVLASSVALRESFATLGATNIAVFGSVARREERDDSDIDLLVDLDANVGLFALLRMRRIAEQLLG